MSVQTPAIPQDVCRDIEARLRQIEREHEVRIFYACESGSRAWGFASTDSDYDVRFLYAHPRAWYLSIDLERRRDVIEQPITDALDLSGWDLRKALGLMRKSNPPLLEWLRSPVVYRAAEPVCRELRALVPAHYSRRAASYHYLSMAQGTFRDYLRRDEVRLKKYFYVLRPLLAVRWVAQDRGPVPMEFARLVGETLSGHDAVREAIARLLREKRAGEELDYGPRRPVLHDFIEAEFARHAEHHVEHRTQKPGVERLNRFFRHALDLLT
jgi:predicted nucleotidyltransferase